MFLLGSEFMITVVRYLYLLALRNLAIILLLLSAVVCSLVLFIVSSTWSFVVFFFLMKALTFT